MAGISRPAFITLASPTVTVATVYSATWQTCRTSVRKDILFCQWICKCFNFKTTHIHCQRQLRAHHSSVILIEMFSRYRRTSFNCTTQFCTRTDNISMIIWLLITINHCRCLKGPHWHNYFLSFWLLFSEQYRKQAWCKWGLMTSCYECSSNCIVQQETLHTTLNHPPDTFIM